MSPSASAEEIFAIAGGISAGVLMGGSSNAIGAARERRRGDRRSKHRRTAQGTSLTAARMALRTIISASPSSSASANKVARFLLPGGRPAGFPLWPFWNGMGLLLCWNARATAQEAFRERLGE